MVEGCCGYNDPDQDIFNQYMVIIEEVCRVYGKDFELEREGAADWYVNNFIPAMKGMGNG